MHGERSPWYEREEEFINGVRQLTSGQDNEVWSFGEENYEIMKKYLFIRENLRDYIREGMKTASENGTPIMRPVFYDFSDDSTAWETEDEYMFGPDLLVAPVMEEGASNRTIYLPKGAKWKDAYTGETYDGGQTVTVPAPIDIIPVMIRDCKDIKIY
jgi:alpha-D-xyloside xylohydrolase